MDDARLWLQWLRMAFGVHETQSDLWVGYKPPAFPVAFPPELRVVGGHAEAVWLRFPEAQQPVLEEALRAQGWQPAEGETWKGASYEGAENFWERADGSLVSVQRKGDIVLVRYTPPPTPYVTPHFPVLTPTPPREWWFLKSLKAPDGVQVLGDSGVTDSPKPYRHRWFALDTPHIRDALRYFGDAFAQQGWYRETNILTDDAYWQVWLHAAYPDKMITVFAVRLWAGKDTWLVHLTGEPTDFRAYAAGVVGGKPQRAPLVFHGDLSLKALQDFGATMLEWWSGPSAVLHLGGVQDGMDFWMPPEARVLATWTQTFEQEMPWGGRDEPLRAKTLRRTLYLALQGSREANEAALQAWFREQGRFSMRPLPARLVARWQVGEAGQVWWLCGEDGTPQENTDGEIYLWEEDGRTLAVIRYDEVPSGAPNQCDLPLPSGEMPMPTLPHFFERLPVASPVYAQQFNGDLWLMVDDAYEMAFSEYVAVDEDVLLAGARAYRDALQAKGEDVRLLLGPISMLRANMEAVWWVPVGEGVYRVEGVGMGMP